MAQDSRAAARGRFDRWFEVEVIDPMADFQDPRQEWRRLASELFGTFFLVLVAAGGGMMSQAFPDTISRQAAVVAPGLMVMGIILFMGKVSGAHLNPAVTLAFSLRGDFPWRRVPGYILVQLIGATLAAWFLYAVIGVSASYGSNYPADGLHLLPGVLDGGGTHPRTGERDPGYSLGRAEHRHHRRDRRRRLHRPRRALGQPDLGHVDEPGPHVRPRPGHRSTSPITGCTSPGRLSARSSRSGSRSYSAATAVAAPAPPPHRAR